MTSSDTADQCAQLAEQIERRAAGFAARGDTIFNGSIIAEELRRWRDEVAALSALQCESATRDFLRGQAVGLEQAAVYLEATTESKRFGAELRKIAKEVCAQIEQREGER